jgi:hypothetical protein
VAAPNVKVIYEGLTFPIARDALRLERARNDNALDVALLSGRFLQHAIASPDGSKQTLFECPFRFVKFHKVSGVRPDTD